MSKQFVAVLLATVAVMLIAAQSLGLFVGGSLTLVSPWSFALIVPTLIGIPPWLVPLLWGGAFIAWHPALLRGAAAVPPRTVGLWLAITMLSAAYFVVSWRAGAMFQGRLFTGICLAVNLVAFGVCSLLLRRAHVKPSFARTLSLQLSLFVWISTYAFPYLGSGVIG